MVLSLPSHCESLLELAGWRGQAASGKIVLTVWRARVGRGVGRRLRLPGIRPERFTVDSKRQLLQWDTHLWERAWMRPDEA